jgi:hypothetical protein
MPAKCVSSISPRFHYRRLAFYFLPLATILEIPLEFLAEVLYPRAGIDIFSEEPNSKCLGLVEYIVSSQVLNSAIIAVKRA